jgi:PAS domain S-box-containing protein
MNVGAVGDIDGGLGGARTGSRLREALAAGGVGVWSWDLSSDRFSADEIARALWGLAVESEITAEQVLEAVHPDDVERVRAIGAASRFGGVEVDEIFRVRRAGGETRWTRVRGRVESDGGGRRVLGVTIDVTQRIRAETALSESEERLQRAQELGGAHPFEWDARTDSVVAGPGLKALYGLTPQEPMNLAVFLARVHPDDRVQVEEGQYRLLEEPGPYEAEFRVVWPDETVRWLLSRGQCVHDPNGVPTGIAGIVIDITGRKHAEDELRRNRREARSRFRELKALYNSAPVGLALLDRDLRFVRVNDALAGIYGLPPDAHIGRHVFDVVPDLRKTLEPPLRRVLESGEPMVNVPVEGETARSPGLTRHWIKQFYAVADDFGTITGVGIVCEEVTERRQVEQARDLLSRELSHRIKNLFAVVSSLISLSARGNETAERFARVIRGRIEALGRAHDYVRPTEWGGDTGAQSRTLQSLLSTLLTAYRDEDDRARIHVQGADTVIGPTAATALALAVHEFATNALKYGALSVPGGFVEIDCAGIGDSFELRWVERGGPPVERSPTREGFGSLLARRSVTSDLGGSLTTDWAQDGLVIRLVVPLERLGR